MAEYIEREAAIAALPVAWDSAVDALRYAPAADVAPVVHGRWIEYPRAHYFKCGECKYTVPYRKAHLTNGKREYNYCPNCGAKMDGGAENAVD